MGDGAIDRGSDSALAFSLQHLVEMASYDQPSEPALGLFGGRTGCRPVGEDTMTALVVGLVSIAVIWLVVIYGSLYLNKNVQ